TGWRAAQPPGWPSCTSSAGCWGITSGWRSVSCFRSSSGPYPPRSWLPWRPVWSRPRGRPPMGDLWLAVRWLHLLAMAFFVGGQLLLAVAVVPVERCSPDRERLRAVARRFGYGTLVAIAVLLATGSAMASHYHLWGDGTLQL